jgi:uncharacterized RDD family membrane protein YckC
MTEAPPPPPGDDSSTGSTPPPDAPGAPPAPPSAPPAPPSAPPAPPSAPPAPPSAPPAPPSESPAWSSPPPAPPAPGGFPPPPPPPGDGGFGAPPPQPYGSQPAFGGGYGQQPAYGGQAAPAAGAYAEWPQRVLASLIDAAIVIAGYIVIIIVAAILGKIAGALGALVLILGYLAMLAFAVWNQILVQGNTGQSIGKKQIGIKLISEQTGQPLGPLMTFVRQIAHFLDGICFIGYLWPLWDPKKQTFADKIMTSIVIKL